MKLRYISSAVLVLLAKVLTYLLAPILAVLVTKAEESETTGYPSLHPGKSRYFLIKPLRLLQTHDAPLDEYYYGGYYEGKWTERFKDNKWFMRVCWLWRNPAYGIAYMVGFDQKGIRVKTIKDQYHLRNSGEKNSTRLLATNAKGQEAFFYFKQIPYGKRCLELYFGWKFYNRKENERGMLVVRFKPFKELK